MGINVCKSGLVMGLCVSVLGAIQGAFDVNL